MKKRRWHGQMTAELLQNYKQRTPRCRHFLHCGGCSFLDFEYKDQLEVKKKKVEELFAEKLDLKEEINIFGDEEWKYRTRMDFVVGKDGIGLRRKRRFDEIEVLQECYLIDNEVLQFLRSIFEKGMETGLVPYDLVTHEGEWRYMSVRINEKNELMLIFVTKSGVEKKISNLKSQISNLQEDNVGIVIKSIYHVVNDGLADLNFGETVKYWGDEFLEFEICGIKYDVGPNTFFQNNIPLVNKLVEKIVDNVDKDDKVLDLYCGVGTLSLPVAKKCGEVYGVELMEESIEMAKKNAARNDIENVGFEAEDVENMFKKFDKSLPPRSAKLSAPPNLGGELGFPRDLSKYNVLMLDPPRKGLEKVSEKLLECDFEKIIYMSCNPLSLARDLEVLTQKWRIDEMTLWDLYPQTPHVEVLVVLSKK